MIDRTVEHSDRPTVFVHTTFQRRLAIREAGVGILPASRLTTDADRNLQFENLEDLVGRTPLLGFLGPHGSKILAKLESQNPTESHYDKVYVDTIRELERRRLIKPGDDLYEVTSGSAGISFAWTSNRLGYNAHIFVPKGTPIGRNQEMLNFGADLIETDSEFVAGASTAEQRQFIRIARSRGLQPIQYTPDDGMFHLWMTPSQDGPGMLMVNHSENHFTHHSIEEVGREVAAIVPPDMNIDYFVSIIGNGTNTRGISDGLRERFTNLKVIGVETVGNPIHFTIKYPGAFEEIYGHAPAFERQQMIGASQKGVNNSFLSPDMIEEIQLVTDEIWQAEMARYNTRHDRYTLYAETIGRTTAAGLVVAKRLDAANPGSNILLVFYDKGDRYDDLRRASPGGELRPLNSYIHDFASSPSAESSVVQPAYWTQWRADSFDDLPADLFTAYQGKEVVHMFNEKWPSYRQVV